MIEVDLGKGTALQEGNGFLWELCPEVTAGSSSAKHVPSFGIIVYE